MAIYRLRCSDHSGCDHHTFVQGLLQQFSLQKAFQGKRKVSEEALFDSRTSFIISWSGMRGIVSLAIVVGLPVKL